MSAVERREGRWTFPEVVGWFDAPFGFLRPLGAPTIRVEEAQDGTVYTIRAELPGVDPDNIDVTLTGRLLQISAERQDERSEPHRSEFRYGSLTRSLTLPSGVGADNVTATYDKGILEVHIELTRQETQPHKVPVATP